jgi:hypothetical protein
VSRLKVGLGVLVALLMTAAIGALSQVPYRAVPAGQAWIRLSWRVSAPRIEECRTLTAEELAKLPVHMRRDEVCETTGIPYRLRIVLNGEGVEETLIRGAGTRGDRPIYVYRELRVPSGTHRLEIILTPEAGVEASAGDAPVEALELAEDLDLADGDVALITRSEVGRLVVRRAEP